MHKATASVCVSATTMATTTKNLLGSDDHQISVLLLSHPFSNPRLGLLILIVVL